MVGSRLLMHLADAAIRGSSIRSHRPQDRADIGLGGVPELLVFNKRDRADPRRGASWRAAHAEALFISAVDGEGIDVCWRG